MTTYLSFLVALAVAGKSLIVVRAHRPQHPAGVLDAKEDGYDWSRIPSVFDAVKEDHFSYLHIGTCVLMLVLSLTLFCVNVKSPEGGKLGVAAEEEDDSGDEAAEPDKRTGSCWFSELLRKKQRTQAGFGLAFADADMEQAWVLESLPRNMQRGGALMAGMAGGLLIHRIFYVEERLKCTKLNYQEKWRPDLLFAGSLVIACLGALTLAWTKGQARRAVSWGHTLAYWGAMLYFGIAFLATSLLPLNPSCNDLANEEGLCPTLYRIIASKLDCTLQGHTACQILLLFLLSLPFALPQFYHQAFALVWLFGFYLAATVFYESLNDSKFERLHHKDIPFHLALLIMAWSFSATRKYYLEMSMRRQFIGGLQQRQAMAPLYYMFKEMVPEYLIPRMLEAETIADPVGPVTVLFVLIDNFNEFSSRKEPKLLLEFLNVYFKKMDGICAAHQVTKIETVAEEYVACVGVTPADQEVNGNLDLGHRVLLERLVKASQEILGLQDIEVQGDKVKFKMGMHTGDIVAGVIGSKLPRFRLFGDTINTSARMMQKALPGTVQFGMHTRQYVNDSMVKDRGEVEMKGKGKVQCFVLQPQEDAESGAAKAQGTVAQDTVEYSESWREVLQSVMSTKEDNAYLVLDKDNQVVPWSQSTYAPTAEAFPLKVVRKDDDEFDKIMDAQLSADAAKLHAKEEKEWFCWWHRTAVCRSFAVRQNFLTFLVAAASLLEIIHMEHIKGWESNDSRNSLLHLDGHCRFRVFLLFRVAAFLICLGWSLLAQLTNWLEEDEEDPGGDGEVLDVDELRLRRQGALHAKAWTVQLALLCTKVVLSLLVWLSYNVLVLHRMGVPYQQLGPLEYLNQQFSLVFMVAFFIVMNVHPLTFLNSLVFILLAVFLMALRDHTPLYVSGVGRAVFVCTAVLTAILTYLGEQSSRALFKSKKKVKETQRRIHGILQTLMPAEVLETLHKLGPGSAPSHHYNQATITQSDLCGFTQLSSTRTPREVVGFMGDLFGRFDTLASEFGIYKVETVGDAYIAGMAWVTDDAGKPLQKLTEKNSALEVVKFGLKMIQATAEWAEGMNVKVTCRVGVHHGECIGGIVGSGMMRYHLFGKFMGQVDILEATSMEGRCQISRACMEKVWEEAGKDALSFEERREGQEELKTSKGEVHDYEEVGGGPTYLVEASLESRVRSLEDSIQYVKQQMATIEKTKKAKQAKAGADEDWDWDTAGRVPQEPGKP